MNPHPIPPPPIAPPPIAPPSVSHRPSQPSPTLLADSRNPVKNKAASLLSNKSISISSLNTKILNKLKGKGVMSDSELAFCDEIVLSEAGLTMVEKAEVLRMRFDLQKQIVLVPMSILPATSSLDPSYNSDYTVYSWGSDVYGRLGHATDCKHADKPKEILYFKGTKLMMIESGAAHTIALSKDGNVWSWGKSHVHQVTCSERLDESSLVARLRTVESWPAPLLVRELVPTDTLKITYVTAGYQHCLALSAAGQVYAWGSRLGCGTGNKDSFRISSPTLIGGALGGVFIVKVAAGGKGNAGGHSIAIDDQGHVYGWGDNDHGQLGINPSLSKVIMEPIQIPIFSGHLPISEAAAGHAHTLLLSSANLILVAGGSSVLDSFTFRQMSLLPPLASSPVQLSAFARQSACVTGGKLIMWGDGEVPRTIHLPSAAHSVSVGERHVLCILTDGTAYCWGDAGTDSGDNKMAITGHGTEDCIARPRKLLLSGAAYLGCASGNSTFLCTT